MFLNIQSSRKEKKLSSFIEKQIIQFVKQHEHVRPSPNMNDTLKIGERLVGKLILEISVNDLLMDISKSGIDGILDDQGNLTLSDTNFRLLLKKKLPQLKRATEKHKQSCCCDICLTMMNMHQQLLKHRVRKVASLEKEWRTSIQRSSGTRNPVILRMINNSIHQKNKI